MTKWILGAGALIIAGLATLLLLRGAGDTPAAQIRFAEITRGPLVVTVTATGQLQPVTQVDVGTQVSGTLESILVDFNSRVQAGEVLAHLNTDNLEARMANNRANLKRAIAVRERLDVESKSAARQLERLQNLEGRGVVSESELDAAQLAFDAAEAVIKVSDAETELARTALRQSEIDLGNATITSPIDGIVIERAVEVGQTVAASFNSPLLFRIAKDLSQMQIRASIDEADIGRVQGSQGANFTVDAFPGLNFSAVLESVRLNPVVTNNVVIYTCLFRVQNPGEDGAPGPLLPGLTANMTILIDKREDALLAPAAALRFRPKGNAAVQASTDSPQGEANGPGPDGNADAAASRGNLWKQGAGDLLHRVAVVTGLSDGVLVEVTAGEIRPGDLVAIGQSLQETTAPGSFTPFGGARPARRGGSGR